MVERRVRAGLVPQSVVSVTGLPVTEAVLEARRRGVLDRLPMFDRITPDGVAWDAADAEAPRFVEADVILWCTGWRAALDHLAPLRLRAPGGGIAMDGTRVVGEPRLHLVGYGPSASTVGANRAGREAVREIRALLAAREPALHAAWGKALIHLYSGSGPWDYVKAGSSVRWPAVAVVDEVWVPEAPLPVSVEALA